MVEDLDLPRPKKVKIMEPDVVVIVGGKEFKEYSNYLCSISEYFDAAFRSGMKESQEMKFEFPDKNPDEWEFIMSLSTPLASTEIDEDNLDVALTWFDELCSTKGLATCDRALYAILDSEEFSWIYCLHKTPEDTSTIACRRETVRRVLDYTAKCYQFNLTDSLTECEELLAGVFKAAPTLLTLEGVFKAGPTLLTLESWRILCRLLSEEVNFPKCVLGYY